MSVMRPESVSGSADQVVSPLSGESERETAIYCCWRSNPQRGVADPPMARGIRNLILLSHGTARHDRARERRDARPRPDPPVWCMSRYFSEFSKFSASSTLDGKTKIGDQ